MTIGPAPILAAAVAIFNVGLYVLVRGRVGARLPLLLIAAWLGAWAGDAVGGRLAIDLLQIGDFNLLVATVFAWLGIAVVAVLATLGPVGPTSEP